MCKKEKETGYKKNIKNERYTKQVAVPRRRVEWLFIDVCTSGLTEARGGYIGTLKVLSVLGSSGGRGKRRVYGRTKVGAEGEDQEVSLAEKRQVCVHIPRSRRQHTSAHVSVRQQTSAGSISQPRREASGLCART